MKAIAFTGLARSGKDTAADYLVKRYGFRKVVLSEQALPELEKEGKPPTKINRSLMAEKLRERHGKEVLAERALKKARGFERAVFTGVHQVAEVEFFRNEVKEFHLVAVRAGPGKRFGRRTSLDAETRQGFFERDRHDTQKFELGKVVAMADYTIPNNSTIAEFEKAIDELMQKL